MPSPFQAATLLGAPSFPNAIAWSEENLIAVASGHLITILRPGVPLGPRGLVTVSSTEPPFIGLVDRKDLVSGCLLPVSLSRDHLPTVRSISWSPVGMASNSGCFLAVCTAEGHHGHVKIYHLPFSNFCAEWIQVMDITERLYDYLLCTEFGDISIPSSGLSTMQVEKQRSAHGMPNAISRKGHMQKKIFDVVSRDSGNQLLSITSSDDGNACSSSYMDTEGQVSESTSGLLRNASDQMVSMSKIRRKSSKNLPENHMRPLITADQYASRSAMLCSIVVSWSPFLHATSELHPVPNTCASVSLLAVGGKSGNISFWRFDAPDCYTIVDSKVPSNVKLVGLLQAHNSWVTTISWGLFASDSSNPQILLATGSSDGSVKVWLGDNDLLLKTSQVNNAPFHLLKEVVSVNIVPVSVVSVIVPVQSLSNMLLAIGKGSGSFEIWLCDIPCSEFLKLGSYDAHNHVITGLVWAFDGRYLYSCSQDNLVRGWILHENCLNEVTISTDIPHSDSSNLTCLPTDALDSCFGVAVSPGSLVIATVHGFDVEKLNRMYEGRILRAAIEYFWIGGQKVDLLPKTPASFNGEEYLSFPEKELTYWGANIIQSLKWYQCPEKCLVLWDIIAALLAFKKHNLKYVEHILMKWVSVSFLRSHMDLPVDKVLSHVSSNLYDIPSRLLHLLNIICRRVMLAELDADQINGLHSNLQNWEKLCPAKEKHLTKWIEILLNSERELRDRLVGISFSSWLSNMSYSEATPSQPGCWHPLGIAQMKQWTALNQDLVHDQLKALTSDITQERRFLFNKCSAAETCCYCSASVPFESPEVGFCQGEDSRSGKVQSHRLLRCSVSMQVCPATPLWFCICCHRSAFRLPPETLFRMSGYPQDLESYIKSFCSKPFCPFCGILLQRKLPDFLLTPTPV